MDDWWSQLETNREHDEAKAAKLVKAGSIRRHSHDNRRGFSAFKRRQGERKAEGGEKCHEMKRRGVIDQVVKKAAGEGAEEEPDLHYAVEETEPFSCLGRIPRVYRLHRARVAE